MLRDLKRPRNAYDDSTQLSYHTPRLAVNQADVVVWGEWHPFTTLWTKELSSYDIHSRDSKYYTENTSYQVSNTFHHVLFLAVVCIIYKH